MYREAIEKLIKWKSSNRRKPLIIEGARQVGKTWLVKEFASNYYKNLIYINFEQQLELRNIFQQNLNIKRILLDLEAVYSQKIDATNTLIFFDEIQEAKNGLTVLKYFCEDAPELNVIVAGSLLGVLLHKKESFPVGKVEFMQLYPLNFKEFLMSMGENGLLHLIEEHNWESVNLLSAKYQLLLKQYLYVGGMPEVVKNFVESKDWSLVREIQKEILESYRNDFSKHAPKELVPRILQVWDSLPTQLSKENKKFIYGVLREGARAREYELAIQWLEDSGLIHKVNNVTAPRMPLMAYVELSIFKIYCNDIGLLGAMAGLSSKTLVEGNEVFKEFNGALTEQYAFQQLIQNNTLFYYAKTNSQQEIDFLLQIEEEIVPVEVKAGINLQAKSLRHYVKENHPRLAYRVSLSNYKKEDWLTNLPLYCISEIKNAE